MKRISTPMKASTLAFLSFAMFCVSAEGNTGNSRIYVDIFLNPWYTNYIYREPIDSIRKGAFIHTEIRDKFTAMEFVKLLRVGNLQNSTTNASTEFKVHLVIDISSSSGTVTFVSDGNQICTAELSHCAVVDENFKRRFDPLF